MFGPVRGQWGDTDWRGWWGEEPGFKHPVFILTHYPREAIDFGNGTIFNFVTGGVNEACERAMAAAGEKVIRVGGGAQVLQQFLEASILDELHLAISPVNLGSGEKLFTNPDAQLKSYRAAESAFTGVEHKTYFKI